MDTAVTFYVPQEHVVEHHRGLPPQLARAGWTGLMAVTECGGQLRGGHHGEPTRVGMGRAGNLGVKRS